MAFWKFELNIPVPAAADSKRVGREIQFAAVRILAISAEEYRAFIAFLVLIMLGNDWSNTVQGLASFGSEPDLEKRHPAPWRIVSW